MRPWVTIAGFVSGRRTAWIALAMGLLLAGAIIALGGSAQVSNDAAATLPPGAESSRVTALQKRFASGQTNTAIVVYERTDAPLADADLATIDRQAATLRGLAAKGMVPPAQLSEDKRAAILVVPLTATGDNQIEAEKVTAVRSVVRDALPGGLTAQVTGGAAFSADLSKVFDGANVTLLLTTVLVVATLLIITYRSPWLWIVPLVAVAIADQVTSALLAIASRHTDLTVNGATTGIVEVLVFGAGTDYALLLISRYREELRRHDDRHVAMRQALITSGPTIAASGLTVALSLASLIFATLPSNTGIGVGSAIGVLCAVAFGLLVLPAALVVFGRWLFWPLVPRAGQPDRQRTGVWARIGHGVARRPGTVVAISLATIALLSSGLLGTRVGLSQDEQFRSTVESIEGLHTLGDHFPAGASDPIIVLANADQAPAVVTAAQSAKGVVAARVSDQAGTLVRIDVTMTAAPDTPESYDTIRALRDKVHAVAGADAQVGGNVATTLDGRDAAARDQWVVIPIVLAIVLIVLIVLLRALLGPVLLVATVVASYFAALGASAFAFTHWFGYPAIETSVPLLSFLFLVALGVDYNIFLVSRGREQAQQEGTRPGILTALAVTGGVITSAGVLLAAVFAVLGVLPLITLTEIGIIVGFGVLLDTLLIRTLLVPAIVTLLDRRFWWPGSLSRRDNAPPTHPEAVPSSASTSSSVGHR